MSDEDQWTRRSLARMVEAGLHFFGVANLEQFEGLLDDAAQRAMLLNWLRSEHVPRGAAAGVADHGTQTAAVTMGVCPLLRPLHQVRGSSVLHRRRVCVWLNVHRRRTWLCRWQTRLWIAAPIPSAWTRSKLLPWLQRLARPELQWSQFFCDPLR